MKFTDVPIMFDTFETMLKTLNSRLNFIKGSWKKEKSFNSGCAAIYKDTEEGAGG